MDEFGSEFSVPVSEGSHGRLGEQRIRELAESALAERGLVAACTIDTDESTTRVAFTIAARAGELRRTTRFSADADADLVAALVAKAAKRIDRDLQGSSRDGDAGRHHGREH